MLLYWRTAACRHDQSLHPGARVGAPGGFRALELRRSAGGLPLSLRGDGFHSGVHDECSGAIQGAELLMAADEEPTVGLLMQLLIHQAHTVGVTPLAPDELRATAKSALQALRAKNGARRYELSVTMLSELLEQGPALLRGGPAERTADWDRCATSVAVLWLTAAEAWRSGAYSIAAALSITCLEETGKLAAERLRLWGVDTITALAADVPSQETRRRRTLLFRDHLSKHVLAAMSGALINARLDRVLGTDFVTAFLDDAEAGKLERFRQACLYLDWKDGALHVPTESVSADQAARYVALSGEVLAEIQPDPAAWSRVLERAKEFEQSAGISPE
jgi:AbiV family abortive infection protein